MFISSLIDVAGHAGKVDAAFEILQEARAKGMHVGIISYSSLMGACSKVLTYYSCLKSFLHSIQCGSHIFYLLGISKCRIAFL